MDADDATVRAWARDHGVPVNIKGKVSQAARDAYSAAHNGHEPPLAPDYPPGMSDADFDLADAVLPDDDDLRETPPRPAPKRAGSGGRSIADRFRRKPPAKGKAKAKPRISTAELIGSAWRIGAKLAQPIPPMYRTLRLQSVIAGPLLDDAVKGTVADAFLQPLARLGQAGEATAALLAPNLAIGAMAWHVNQTAKAGQEPNPVVMQGCAEMLRYGLVTMMRVGGDAFAQQLAKERDEEERYGASVDMLIEWIMSEPANPAEEEANIARMASVFAGERIPEPAAA